MHQARKVARGQPVVTLGLELFLEEVAGVLEFEFQGTNYSALAFAFDGCQEELLVLEDAFDEEEQGAGGEREMAATNAVDAMTRMGGLADHAIDPGAEIQTPQYTTRDAEVQTLWFKRNARKQSRRPRATHTGVRTEATETMAIDPRADNVIITPMDNEMADLFPETIDLTSSDALTLPLNANTPAPHLSRTVDPTSSPPPSSPSFKPSPNPSTPIASNAARTPPPTSNPTSTSLSKGSVTKTTKAKKAACTSTSRTTSCSSKLSRNSKNAHQRISHGLLTPVFSKQREWNRIP